MLRRTLLRRSAFALTGVAALTAAFVLGVVAGAGSTPDDLQDSHGVLDDAADQIAGSSLLPVDRDALDAAAIKAMLAAAGDAWGSWGEGTAAKGSYAGVGLWLRLDSAQLVVSQVAQDSPAHDAGIAVGDLVTSVDDRSTLGMSPTDVTSLLRGRPGSTVSLVVAHGGVSRPLTLTRARVAALEVTTTMLTPRVGRISIPAFGQGTGHQVRDAVKALGDKHVTGIVLDLRGDPGGLLAEAVETASAFLDGGDVVSYTRRGEAVRHLAADGKGDTRTPLVVLVDGGTASAAEVVAGALQDRGRAVIVGSRTFGKGTVQEPHALPDGSDLALTVATYALPSGRSVEGVGLEPDIDVEGNVAVARAVEVLSGLLADSGVGRG
ncbi:MAG: S41 family peptidase [Mycobacteriales bacterium]